MSDELEASVKEIIKKHVTASNAEAVKYRKLVGILLNNAKSYLESIERDLEPLTTRYYTRRSRNYAGMHEHNERFMEILKTLEILDCGSVGGFSDEIRRANGDGSPTVEERWKFIYKKYSKEAKDAK